MSDHRSLGDKFDRLFSEIRDLRDEMRASFAGLRGDVAEVRRELSEFQRHGSRIVAGFAVGLLGALVAAQF